MAVADEATAVPLSRDSTVARLKPPGSVKFFYAFGQVVESGYIAANGFIFFYYTAVLGLSGSLVGAALAISLCIDAAADPFIGSVSDGLRSRLGRRLPLMLLGAPLTLLTMGLLFGPPAALSPFLLFGWLTLTKVGFRGFASVYNIPYFALGGEMSDDYAERASIVAIRLFAGIMITVLISALAFSVFFAGEGGLQRPEPYPVFGWSIGGLMLVGGLICCLGVWRFAASLPQPTTSVDPMLRRLPREFAEILSNKTFRILFVSMVIFASAVGVHAALQNHVYVFVWKLRPEAIQFVTYTYLGGLLLGVPITPMVLRFMEKKTAVLWSFGVVIAGLIILPGARALGLFMPTGSDALGWLCLNSFIIGLGSGVVLIAYPSMMADAADEHEHLHGHRREGLYFAGLGFAGKAASGIGTLVGGVALDALHFPHDAGREVHAMIPEHILAKLVFAWAPLPALVCVVGALIFVPYAISRARHDEITAALQRKRAEDVRAGRST